MDLSLLLENLLPALKFNVDEPAIVASASAKFLQEMVSRTSPAVLNSRQACLDAHVYSSINDKSPLIARRIAQEGKT